MKITSKIELAIYIALAVCAVGLFFVVKKWHDDSVYELPKVKLEKERIQKEWDLEKESNALTEVRTDGFVKEVVRINDPERKLTGIVCRNASVPTVPEGASPGELAAPEREPGVSGGNPERDVSVGTTVYGKRCELLRAEVETWRLWWRDQNELSRKED